MGNIGIYQTKGNKYNARITVKGKVIHLGSFDTPLEATQMYDAAMLVLGKPRSNYNERVFAPIPEKVDSVVRVLLEKGVLTGELDTIVSRICELVTVAIIVTADWKPTKEEATKRAGVYKVGEVYNARIAHDKKTIHLGSFDNEIEALTVYDAASVLLNRPVSSMNFPDMPIFFHDVLSTLMLFEAKGIANSVVSRVSVAEESLRDEASLRVLALAVKGSGTGLNEVRAFTNALEGYWK